MSGIIKIALFVCCTVFSSSESRGKETPPFTVIDHVNLIKEFNLICVACTFSLQELLGISSWS